ncbi:carboxypeptidase-like regulatory domain-containing protein [Pontibacter anaerobius]|uniref:Carboxypeptidase-like regulatory domain-containing protein n=1 Tax=Pontibacter anaerobius TaxID=2993940 RepID=A0ABT3RJF4_9BACT|nr:carboxypeptidase-like regulatory domain-containing protein [Pontibacter anaerobius]MCX2741747.1 carboxypeptidase-like regulatory domain-containing protein [Pontibacter anaerobius]
MKTPLKLQLYFWFLAVACSLSSCDYEENDYISKYCPGSCTVIKGRVSDQSGAPVVGATMRIRWRNEVYLHPTFTREKAIATTDANGNYELLFLLRDQELVEGYISLESEVNLEQYLSCRGYSQWYLGEIARDTTIIQNYTIAPAATLRLVFHNQEPANQQDRIFTSIKYKLSASDADSCAYVYDSRSGYSSERLPIPAGQPIVLYTESIKDGSRSTRKDTLVLEPNELREYELSF